MAAITHELGYDERIVDLQQGHVKKHNVDQAYDRAEWLKQQIRIIKTGRFIGYGRGFDLAIGSLLCVGNFYSDRRETTAERDNALKLNEYC